MRTLLDLILPQACAGCGVEGTGWCEDCAASLSTAPMRVRPRSDPGVPCWALGPYTGPRRRAVLAAKEHGRRDLAAPLGLALAGGLHRLRTGDRSLLLVPAPTRRSAARRRGGDPVARAARVASSWLSDCRSVPALTARSDVRDSVGLTARERRHNLHGRIRCRHSARLVGLSGPHAETVLVDDVITTGATAAESARTLALLGVELRAVLVVCCA